MDLDDLYLISCPACDETEWRLYVDAPDSLEAVLMGVECVACGLIKWRNEGENGFRYDA
jgi:Zn ribbon nucleic-acid-binding protein